MKMPFASNLDSGVGAGIGEGMGTGVGGLGVGSGADGWDEHPAENKSSDTNKIMNLFIPPHLPVSDTDECSYYASFVILLV